MAIFNFLKSQSGCLVLRGCKGIGKSALVEQSVCKYERAKRAVRGAFTAPDVGVGIEPLLEVFTDLVCNLTAQPGDDQRKHRKILVASTRKIRKGEREAAILLLREVYRALEVRLGSGFDREYYEFMNIAPSAEDKAGPTPADLADYILDNRQVFLNSYIHLLENLALFLSRIKKKVIIHFGRAQRIQNRALAHIADLASRLPDNVFFILGFDGESEHHIMEKLALFASLGTSQLLSLDGLGVADIKKMSAARGRRDLKPDEIAGLKESTDGNPFYLGFLMDVGELPSDVMADAKKAYRDNIRRSIDEKGEEFSNFLTLYSLSRRPLTTDDLAVLSPSDESLTEKHLETAREMGILDGNGHFPHPLTREHIEASSKVDERKKLHGKIAVYREERFSREADEAGRFDFKLVWAICYHYFHSSDREKSYSFNTFMAREGMISSNPDIARIGYERALSDAIMLRSDTYKISVLEKLVKVLETECRWDRALEVHNMLVDHFTSKGDVHNNCIALQRIAAIYQYKGDFDSALKYYKQVLRIYGKGTDRKKVGSALTNIGTLYQIKEDFEDALQTFEEALALAEKEGDGRAKAALHHKIASVYHLDYKYTKALGHYNTSQKLFKEIGDEAGYGESLRQMGNIHFLKGKLESARKYYSKALDILERKKARKNAAEIRYQLGAISQKEKSYKEALDHFNSALDTFREIRDVASTSNTIRTLGDTYLDIAREQICAEHYETARETLEGARRIYAQVGDREGADEAGYLLEDISDIESGKRGLGEVTAPWKNKG